MRLIAALAELAALGATPRGIDRALFTPADHAARTRFAAWARELGATVEQDRVGNVFARLPGRSGARAPLQCGSHLDTVRDGGRYDGAYGVVAALDALAAIGARGTDHPLEAVAWAGEEGSRFPMGTLGSAAYAGLVAYDEIAALRGDDGATFAQAFDGPSGRLDGVPLRERPVIPAAYLEVHVEQGPVLERRGARLGIVTAIAGQRRYTISVDGAAGHAGTLPMEGRADALVAAAEIVVGLEAAARRAGECVATIGRIEVDPNQANVVPGAARMRADLRAPRDATLDALAVRLSALCAATANARGVDVRVAETERRAAVAMDSTLVALVGELCRARDPNALEIVSGAGHDAMCLARVAPAAMIFVPSVGGRSHVGDEETAPADLTFGAEALAGALRAADRTIA